jgi:hypothetical protein
MKTIIINGQRELAELPEFWIAEAFLESIEWQKANRKTTSRNGCFVCNSVIKSFSDIDEITRAEFLRLVYQPWKESQNVELPTDYMELCSLLFRKRMAVVGVLDFTPKHIQACIQLTNIMNFANDAFEEDGEQWEVGFDSWIVDGAPHYNPIRFTSQAAAEWAYKTFPEIFKSYWNV